MGLWSKGALWTKPAKSRQPCGIKQPSLITWPCGMKQVCGIKNPVPIPQLQSNGHKQAHERRSGSDDSAGRGRSETNDVVEKICFSLGHWKGSSVCGRGRRLAAVPKPPQDASHMHPSLPLPSGACWRVWRLPPPGMQKNMARAARHKLRCRMSERGGSEGWPPIFSRG